MHSGRLVKTRRFGDPRYVGDPLNTIRIFSEFGADEVLLLDITRDRNEGRPDLAAIATITSECFVPLGYGGGLRSVPEAEDVLRAGAEKVVFNSALIRDPDVVRSVSESFGRQSCVASIDVRKQGEDWEVFIDSGRQKSPLGLRDHVGRAVELGAGEILLGSIDSDGLRCGYDLNLVRTVASLVSIPVVVVGGAGSGADMTAAIRAGANAVAAGSLFVFHGAEEAVLPNYPLSVPRFSDSDNFGVVL